MAQHRQNNDMFDLAIYLISSARDLLDEPHAYGPVRLLEGVNRIIQIGDRNPAFRDPFLSKMGERVTTDIRKTMSDRAEFAKALDVLLLQFADELKRRNVRK